MMFILCGNNGVLLVLPIGARTTARADTSSMRSVACAANQNVVYSVRNHNQHHWAKFRDFAGPTRTPKQPALDLYVWRVGEH